MDKIIVDGRVIMLDEYYSAEAFQRLEDAPEGEILVAVTSSGRVLVRWIDSNASIRICPVIRTIDYKKRSRGIKPTKKLCPWFFAEIESQFDVMANTKPDSLESMHLNFNNDLITRGKNPESYRRWIIKLKKRWVKMIVVSGKRIDDIEALGCIL